MNTAKPTLLTLSSLLLASLVLPTAVQSSPLVSIGDNVDVFFNGSSSLRWTSNVFRDEDQEVDDIIWTVTPGFDINVGRGLSNADFSIITRYDIIRYQDLDQLDTELFHIKAVGSYRTSRLDLNGSVSFDEAKASTGERNIQDLVESDTTRARIDGEYRFSPKLSVGSGYSYSKTEYKTYQEFFADRETSTIPVDLFYELTPKIDLSVGYAYTNTDVSETNTPLGGPFSSFRSDYETDSHFFNVGARGNLLSKVTGFFKVGYRVRDSDDSVVQILNSGAPFGLPTSTSRDSTGMLGLDLDLTWAATPKITARLDMSRDFGVGSEGATTENSTVNGSVSYSINSNWSAQGSAGYTLRDYDDDREDDQYRVGASLSFVPNQYWRFSAGYDFENNDSNEDDRSYENHNLFLSASLRY